MQRIRAGDVLTTVGATRDRQLREGGRTVHINHHLAEMMPALHDRLLRAAREADRDHWRGAADADRPDVGVLDDRAMVALRSAEYHDVRGKAESALPMHLHGDYGSLVTIDLMLSHSSEYEGGVLQTMEADGNLLDHTFEQGDALIFLSHKEHGVTPVTSGRHKIVVCELWEGLPRRCPQRCDQPWYPCHCKYRPLALYSSPRSSPWPPNGPTDMEKLRRNGLADHRSVKAREAREAADRSGTAGSAQRHPAPPQTVADAAASAACRRLDHHTSVPTGHSRLKSCRTRWSIPHCSRPRRPPAARRPQAARPGRARGLRPARAAIPLQGDLPPPARPLGPQLLDEADEPTWARLCEAAVAAAAPVIARTGDGRRRRRRRRCCRRQRRRRRGWRRHGGAARPPRRRPGARVQRLHVDATHAHFEAARQSPYHRLFSVFMPLVDVEADGDGTEFWPTANLAESTRALAKHMSDVADSPLDPSARGAGVPRGRPDHLRLPHDPPRPPTRASASGRSPTCARPAAPPTRTTSPRVGSPTRRRPRRRPSFWNAPGQLRAQDDLDYTEIEGDRCDPRSVVLGRLGPIAHTRGAPGTCNRRVSVGVFSYGSFTRCELFIAK